MNSGAPEGSAGPVPLVASVVLLLNETNMIKYGNRDGHQDGSPATKQMEVQTNIVLRGNRSIYHNTELKLWKHLIGQLEQHKPPSVVLLFLKTRWSVMNEERTGLWFRQNGIYPWSFVTQDIPNGQLSYCGHRKMHPLKWKKEDVLCDLAKQWCLNSKKKKCCWLTDCLHSFIDKRKSRPTLSGDTHETVISGQKGKPTIKDHPYEKHR
jgi:hypothetical protein